MDPVRNPYEPNAGAMPPLLAGRDVTIKDFLAVLGRIQAGRAPRSLIPYGLRGVGKTVLLNYFENQAQQNGFLVAHVEVSDDGAFLYKLVAELRRILISLDIATRVNEAAKRAMRVLKSFVLKVNFAELSAELGVDPARGEGDTGDLAVDLTSLLVAVGEAARNQGKAVLIAIDELQYVEEAEFEALIMALHRLTQLALPVLAVATGLPQVLAIAARAKTYTERLFDFRAIGALSEPDARQAIVAPAAAQGVVFEDAAIDRLYDRTQGYPYFVQVFAYAAWNAAAASPITRDIIDQVEPIALTSLDEGFFRSRYDKTTPSERHYLRAMAELGAGPYRSAEAADLIGQTINGAAPTRDALIKKGIIYSPEHGQLAFTVPLFDGFMRRIEPIFTPGRL
jgi:hypothetical protein